MTICPAADNYSFWQYYTGHSITNCEIKLWELVVREKGIKLELLMSALPKTWRDGKRHGLRVQWEQSQGYVYLMKV